MIDTVQDPLEEFSTHHEVDTSQLFTQSVMNTLPSIVRCRVVSNSPLAYPVSIQLLQYMYSNNINQLQYH